MICCFVVRLLGAVNPKVMFLVSSTAKLNISFSCFNWRAELKIFINIRSSAVFPRLIISAMYSIVEPGIISFGPYTSFITISLCLPFISTSISSPTSLAFNSVQ